MICHEKGCREPIGVGEAVIPEAINGSDRYWFFHPGCYAKRLDEQKKADERIENVRRMAGYVH